MRGSLVPKSGPSVHTKTDASVTECSAIVDDLQAAVISEYICIHEHDAAHFRGAYGRLGHSVLVIDHFTVMGLQANCTINLT